MPPDALSVAHCPLQMVLLVPLTETVGVELTVTLYVDVSAHPLALVPITV